MKGKLYLLTCLLAEFAFNNSFGQSNYHAQIEQAKTEFQEHHYIQSALLFRQAFSNYTDSVKAIDVFGSARSWAAVPNLDSAIIQLQSAILVYKFGKYGMMVADPILSVLHQRKEWAPLTIKVKENMEAAYTPLQRELVTIKDDDQKYRVQAENIRKSEGIESAGYARVSKQMMQADSVNLVKVTHILDTHGWPPYSEIGDTYVALFLVIQHAGLNTQLKYFPIIQKAVNNGDLAPESLAILKDRIAVRQGKKQIYGSQVDYDQASHTYKVFPIDDESM